MTASVAILTPTWKRDAATIRRSVASVRSQTYAGAIFHFVCSDGESEAAPRSVVESVTDQTDPIRATRYNAMGANTNTFGASVRQSLATVAARACGASFVAFLDDDNVIFPDFVETAVAALESDRDAGFAVVRIIHLGPLPSRLGAAPAILTGVPPVVQNIDTLQVVARLDAINAVGWTTKTADEGGYLNDGLTFERLAGRFRYVEVPRVLGVHM